MKRIVVTLLVAAFLAGCSSTQEMSFREASSLMWERTSSALSRIGEPTPDGGTEIVPLQTAATPEDYDEEIEALFAQRYIDPLTDYLATYADDENRAEYLGVVRDERDWRCAAIAAGYADRAPTRANLQRYEAGYNYSCPDDVAAFAERVAAAPAPAEADAQATPTVEQKPDTDPVPLTPEPVMSEQLSECYLLTRIRNFTAARKACEAPAEAGDARSQANMAEIQRTFQNYEEAARWAERAAVESAEAAYLLAGLYHSGQGVDQSNERAVKWYTKAAELGHPDAHDALERYSAAP